MDNTAAEKRTAWVLGALLGVTIAVSTLLHHVFPGVLSVPSCAGIPHTGLWTMFLLDLIPIALAAVCFLHARSNLGLYPAMLFLCGSFFLTGLEENTWIFIGRYIHLLASLSPQMASAGGTYYFTRGFFWWGEAPAYICLGWFFIAYGSVYISCLLLPRSGMWARAALGGFLAMNLDLWLDPVQVSAAWQSWKWIASEPIKVLSIPLTNFAGWFLLIFLFAALFEHLGPMREKFGAGKAAARFFLIILGMDVGVILGFMVYGYMAMRFITAPVNLTLWGL